MHEELDSILTRELLILNDLITLNTQLSQKSEVDVADLNEVLAKRSLLIEELSALENQASEILKTTPLPPQLTEKSSKLINLAKKLEKIENSTKKRLGTEIEGLRKETSVMAKGKKGLSGYGDKGGQTPRFTDRKG
jgi:flagellar biosynthesis/type III secretory pathway chaperone